MCVCGGGGGRFVKFWEYSGQIWCPPFLLDLGDLEQASEERSLYRKVEASLWRALNDRLKGVDLIWYIIRIC